MQRLLALLAAAGTCSSASKRAAEPPALSFGLPHVVDKLKQAMPDDFLAFVAPGSPAGAPAFILGREFNTLSSDGVTWRNASASGRHFSSVIHHFPKQCEAQACTEVTAIGAWVSSNATHWATDKSWSFSLSPAAPHDVVTKRNPGLLSFSGLPRPSKATLRMGGTTSVTLPGGRGMLFTAIVRWGGVEALGCNHSLPAATSCNQSSIVVYHANAKGKDWRFLSALADAHDYPESLEGPNEHDLTLGPDGKTLVAVVRFDGGDGPPHHNNIRPFGPPHYLPYHRTISRNFGKSWDRLQPIAQAGCARPRLLVMGNRLLLSGGRFRVGGNTSDVLLWVSEDGYGEAWESYSLSYQHNLGVKRGGGANVPPFNSLVNLSNTSGTGPRQTNAYTSLARLDSERFVVLYDQKLMLDERTKPPFHLNISSYAMVVALNAKGKSGGGSGGGGGVAQVGEASASQKAEE